MQSSNSEVVAGHGTHDIMRYWAEELSLMTNHGEDLLTGRSVRGRTLEGWARTDTYEDEKMRASQLERALLFSH